MKHYSLFIIMLMSAVLFCSPTKAFSKGIDDNWNPFYIGVSTMQNFAYNPLRNHHRHECYPCYIAPDFGGSLILGYTTAITGTRLELDLGCSGHTTRDIDMRILARMVIPFALGDYAYIGPLLETGTAFTVKNYYTGKNAFFVLGCGLDIGWHISQLITLSASAKVDAYCRGRMQNMGGVSTAVNLIFQIP